MSISAIGNSGLNVSFSAAIQTASPIGGTPASGGLDPLALGPSLTGIGAGASAGTLGNSSVNTVNALATALLIGALSPDEEDKKSDPLAGAAAALLAYTAILGLNQTGGINPSSAGLTAGAISGVAFSATA